MRGAPLLVAVGVLGFLTACEAEIPDGLFLCDPGVDDGCPSGQTCCPDVPLDGFEGRCQTRCEPAPDAGADAGLDAAVTDAGAGEDAGPRDAGLPDAGGDAAVDGGVPLARPISLALGLEHSCLLLDDGSVHCWGDNRGGELGVSPDTIMSRTLPGPVSRLMPAVQIAASSAATCARHATGVQCWGTNEIPCCFATGGPLGDADILQSETPIDAQISGVPHDLAMGAFHACAVVGDDRHLECWGDNRNGQLGVGDTLSRGDPIALPTPIGVSDVCAGNAHTCAVVGGEVYCWGQDADGQLGNGEEMGASPDVSTPRQVPGLAGVTAVACGAYHTCALAGADGARTVTCWGGNRGGQTGQPPAETRVHDPAPAPDGRAVDVDLLALGGRTFGGQGFSCVAGSGLALHCFGSNNVGQLGVGATTPAESAEWRAVRGPLDPVVDVALGGAHACAIAGGELGDRVLCWGEGARGQLGNGTIDARSAPTEVFGFGAE